MDICRVCLSSGANKNICQTQAPKNQGNQSFMNVLKFCLDIQVIEDSKVTTMVCLKCYKKVLSFHKFKSLAMKNDAYLRSLDVDVYLTDSIKIEETEIEDNTLEVDSLNLEMKSESGHEECVDDGKELESDDELLSVIKNIKYEYVEEIKEIAPIIKKRGRPKIIKNNVEKKKLEVCDECGKSVRNLKDHMNVHLPPLERRSLKCKVCERVFSSHSARHKHHKIKHLGIKNHCNICDKDIVATLKHHMLIKHRTHELPHACASCERRFISRSALESHITTHTKDRPFECFDCGKAFRLKVVLVHHRRQVHEQEKSHLCQFCSKSFYKKYHLQVHLRSHTKEKPYTCPECGKCFSTTTVLKNHRLVHSDLKNFQCSLCDASFRRLGYLRNHMLSHTKEKRHPCKYCGQRFGRSDHRKRHEFTAHEKNLTAA